MVVTDKDTDECYYVVHADEHVAHLLRLEGELPEYRIVPEAKNLRLYEGVTSAARFLCHDYELQLSVAADGVQAGVCLQSTHSMIEY